MSTYKKLLILNIHNHELKLQRIRMAYFHYSNGYLFFNYNRNVVFFKDKVLLIIGVGIAQCYKDNRQMDHHQFVIYA